MNAVISKQKSLEEKFVETFEKMKELINNINNKGLDTVFIMNSAKEIAERLITIHIYPTMDEYREAAKSYFTQYHVDLMKTFTKGTPWVGYYEKFIYTPVSLCNLHNIS